jgi:Flp pilus assembly protein TadD
MGVRMRMIFAKTWPVTILFAVFAAAAPMATSQTTPPTTRPARNVELIQDAAHALAAGDLDRADTDLHSALQQDPNDPRALNLLGMVRAAEQRNEDAERIFKRVIQLQPKSANAHVNLGLLYLQMARVDDAVPQFQEALQIEPGRADALGALLNALRTEAHESVRQGNLEKALSQLLIARKASPTNPGVLYDFGYVALRMSLYPDAETAFRQELAERHDDLQALYALGRTQIGLGHYQDAASTFSRYVKINPSDASGHFALGLTLAAVERFPGARAEFQQSIALQPNQTESYVELGRIELTQDNFGDARNDFEHALQTDPHDAGALTGIGRVEFGEKNYEQAVSDLRASIAVDSSQREPHYYLGLSYARLGKKDDSARELQIAGDREREDAERHRVFLKLLDPDQAPPNPTDGP